MNINPWEFSEYADSVLIDVVKNEHARHGRKALEELVSRHDVEWAARKLDTTPERIEELL